MADKREVVVLSAVRAAVGTFMGSLSGMEPADLGGLVVKEAIARSGVDPKAITFATVGNVIPTEARYPYVARNATIQGGMTMESLAKMKPAFDKAGTVTAGNASGINDGASFLVLADAAKAAAGGHKPMARLVSYGIGGVSHEVMGEGPIPSTLIALAKAGLKIDDIGVVESNEAFAAQSLTVAKVLGLDPKKTNPNGGAIAIGHPIGASGAVIVTKALYEAKRVGSKYCLATMCIGGGQGITTIWEMI